MDIGRVAIKQACSSIQLRREPPSPATSTHAPEVEVLQAGSSRATSRSPDVLPVVSVPEALEEGCTTEPSQSASMFKDSYGRVKKSNEGLDSDNPDRPSKKSHRPVSDDTRPRSQSQTRVNATNARYAAGKRQPQTVGKSTAKATASNHANEDTSHSKQSAEHAVEAGPAHFLSGATSEQYLGTLSRERIEMTDTQAHPRPVTDLHHFFFFNPWTILDS
ncbi:hypothetical protein OG21DRAFT_1607419 [Imleria badia]|nr:hypothetical protein OG21DRAFT_1607419 [Imleria badia]